MKFKKKGKQYVIICDKCNSIVKYEKHFTDEEKEAMSGKIKLPAQYCSKCEDLMYE